MTTSYVGSDDLRELILARLAVVLGGLSAGFGRNDPDIPDTALPKITLLDADEDAQLDTYKRGRPASTPNIITMSPEIYVTVTGDESTIGPALSAWEQTILHAITTDQDLTSLVHDNGIEFLGADTAVQYGRAAVGQLSMNFSFRYRLAVLAPPSPAPVSVDGGLDSRESILEALAQVVAETDGVQSFARNDTSVPEDPSVLPRVIMLDGSEQADVSAYGRGRPAYSPNRVVMEPEIYIVAEEDPTLAGPTLNMVRLMLLRNILTNPVLASLVMDGDIRYEGCQTAMGAARGMTGEMGMVISLARVAQPSP